MKLICGICQEVWFCGSKPCVLRCFAGIKLTSDYITIFEDSYLPSLDIFELKRGQGDIYMQNNDPKHTAKITKEWMSCSLSVPRLKLDRAFLGNFKMKNVPKTTNYGKKFKNIS